MVPPLTATSRRSPRPAEIAMVVLSLRRHPLVCAEAGNRGFVVNIWWLPTDHVNIHPERMLMLVVAGRDGRAHASTAGRVVGVNPTCAHHGAPRPVRRARLCRGLR